MTNIPPPIQSATRKSPEAFNLPVEQIRAGFYSDKYFLYARDVMLGEKDRRRVTMQVFQKKEALLCGMDESIAILRQCLSSGFDWGDLEVSALRDGDLIQPWETVMLITGPYAAFSHLETVYLGVLARRTRIATNTRKVVEAAWPKPVLYFPARHDHWAVQAGDGYAAHVAGAVGVSTDAQASLWGASGMGTLPHALIAASGGDTVEAAVKLAKHLPRDVRLIALVDFENDSVATSLAVAKALGPRLYGVRLDTSEAMVDKSVVPMMGGFRPTGVNAQLVRNVRTALDNAGYNEVTISVSGGFDVEKIRDFTRDNVPVDSYGVGSSLITGSYDFTADIVLLEGKPAAKAGRAHHPNPRLQRVE
jgi:nicotinate phosphoribosyltransferase